MTRRTVARGSLTMRQDITKPVSRLYTFEGIAPVGQVCPIRNDQPLMGQRETGADQEFEGAERDGVYVLKQTVTGGTYADTHWAAAPTSLLAGGVIEVFARGYLKNANFATAWNTHGQFFASLMYVGDDALLTHYNHNTGADPQDYIVFYEPQTVAEGWWNTRFQIDLNNNTIKHRFWGGDFDTEPGTWTREIAATDFREDAIVHGPMGWVQAGLGPTSADFIAELAFFGYEVTP